MYTIIDHNLRDCYFSFTIILRVYEIIRFFIAFWNKFGGVYVLMISMIRLELPQDQCCYFICDVTASVNIKPRACLSYFPSLTTIGFLGLWFEVSTRYSCSSIVSDESKWLVELSLDEPNCREIKSTKFINSIYKYPRLEKSD